ncbi:restriction endonuclease subunit S, partial [Prevotella sp. oral taxon 317]|uniref:restriction endonuclease subunit S n=2 Tax=Prevotella TaxID=838 RepID=UPI0001C3FFED
EFEGEWVASRLSEYLNESKERNKKGHFNKTDVLSVSGDFGIVNQIELLGRSFAGASVLPYHIVRLGNIVYTKSPLKEYPYGIVKANTGKDGIVSTLYAVYSVKDNANYKFIEYYFSLANRANRYFKPIVRIGAKHDMKIGNQEVLANQVIFPTVKEQEKIAGFLSLIDDRISNQNKIIEDLKKLKCAIIENVLNNCHDNKMRLGDVGIYIRGLTYSSNDVVEQKGTIVMRSNNIVSGGLLDYCNNVVRVNKQILQEQQLQNGDIVICMANGSSALVGKTSFYDGKCLSPITVGAFCGIYRSKMPITKWLFQTNRYHRYIWNSLQGGNGAIANLNGEDILRMSFPTPDKSTIGHCIKLLSSLDLLIENNVSLCSMFSQQKEYLLQQMFI